MSGDCTVVQVVADENAARSLGQQQDKEDIFVRLHPGARIVLPCLPIPERHKAELSQEASHNGEDLEQMLRLPDAILNSRVRACTSTALPSSLMNCFQWNGLLLQSLACHKSVGLSILADHAMLQVAMQTEMARPATFLQAARRTVLLWATPKPDFQPSS